MDNSAIYPRSTWDYAAECATQDGFTPGSSEWMKRIRVLLPIVTEQEPTNDNP